MDKEKHTFENEERFCEFIRTALKPTQTERRAFKEKKGCSQGYISKILNDPSKSYRKGRIELCEFMGCLVNVYDSVAVVLKD